MLRACSFRFHCALLWELIARKSRKTMREKKQMKKEKKWKQFFFGKIWNFAGCVRGKSMGNRAVYGDWELCKTGGVGQREGQRVQGIAISIDTIVFVAAAAAAWAGSMDASLRFHRNHFIYWILCMSSTFARNKRTHGRADGQLDGRRGRVWATATFGTCTRICCIGKSRDCSGTATATTTATTTAKC